MSLYLPPIYQYKINNIKRNNVKKTNNRREKAINIDCKPVPSYNKN